MNKFQQHVLENKYYIYIINKIKDINNKVQVWYILKMNNLIHFILPKYFKFG